MGIMHYMLEGMVQQEIELEGQRKIWSYEVGGVVRGVWLRKECRIEKRVKKREIYEMKLPVKKAKFLNVVADAIQVWSYKGDIYEVYTQVQLRRFWL